MSPALLGVVLALAAQAGDPCVGTDAAGSFPVCFDPGNRIELGAGGALGDREPARGGALELSAAVRWRRDTRGPGGTVEWLADQTFGEARARFTNGDGDPRAADGLLWRGTFVRHRDSPFILVPGPRPLRLPFPFDVGLLVEVGGASWDAAREDEVDLEPIRSALLLDVGSHGWLRRLSFGPEVSWGVRLARHEETLHRIVPFTGGVLDARLESRDGLNVLALTARGGSVIDVPGGSEPYLDATLSLERIVVAVNDRPVALYLAGTARGGGGPRALEASAGLRTFLRR